jgi:ketosteroid isomerase-like protein
MTDPVETVRRVLAEWERGNWSAGADLLERDAVISWLEPTNEVVAQGAEQVKSRLESFLGQWRAFWIETQDVTPVGDDAVLVVARQFNVGRVSGAQLERLTYIVFRFDGEQIAQIRWNWDREKALASAGLGA